MEVGLGAQRHRAKTRALRCAEMRARYVSLRSPMRGSAPPPGCRTRASRISAESTSWASVRHARVVSIA